MARKIYHPNLPDFSSGVSWRIKWIKALCLTQRSLIIKYGKQWDLSVKKLLTTFQ